MSAPRPHLTVVTPVRNEAWILDRFLAVTSTFADSILIADQGSEDGSRQVCARFPKATVFDNPSRDYDEAARQRFLLELCRRQTPEPRIILALDADEIVAADAVATPEWARMFAAAPGTVLAFHKPDLFEGTTQCLRYERPWPIGYVDDGREHAGRRIHSIRVPMAEGSPVLDLNIHVLHYAMTRLDHQRSKARLYCAIENLHSSQPLFARRHHYSRRRRWDAQGRLTATTPAWFGGWEQLGIDMSSIESQPYYWQDFEVLRLLGRHGSRRFWLDDLWDFDWERCRQYGIARGVADLPRAPVAPPPAMFRGLEWIVDAAYEAWLGARARRLRARASSAKASDCCGS